ncbi:MAG TPA: hypothetical protein VGG61_15955, partial [Gemmataceae bacterium]
VLLDPLRPSEGVKESTGLEAFLTQFSVDVGNNRILDLNGNPPQQVVVSANPALAQSNPVAAALVNVPTLMFDARTVQAGGGGDRPPMGMNFRPEELLFAFPSRGQVVFAETNLSADPVSVVAELIAEIRKGEKEKAMAKNPKSRLPVGVAVSEGGLPPMMMNNPHMPQPPSTPRLLVIGNSRFVSDADIRQASNYDVLASSIAWLRERPSSIGLAPREHKEYQMEATTNLWRLVFLPAGLMMMTILGLGIGIWVVRRR